MLNYDTVSREQSTQAEWSWHARWKTDALQMSFGAR